MNRNTQIIILFLKNLIEQKGVTYYYISKVTGISEPLIRRYFTLEISPSLDKFLQIAEAIGVRILFESNDGLDLNKAITTAVNQYEAQNTTPNEMFSLEKSKEPNYWVATHKQAKIVVKFKQGDFNGTQKVTMLEDFDQSNFTKLATYMRQLGDWLAENHGEIL